MGKRTSKYKKRYVYPLKDWSQITFLIHVPDHSPDECKGLNYFGARYIKGRPFKECGHEINYIVQH